MSIIITRDGSYEVATQSVSHSVTFDLQNWAKIDRLEYSRTSNRWIFFGSGWMGAFHHQQQQQNQQVDIHHDI